MEQGSEVDFFQAGDGVSNISVSKFNAICFSLVGWVEFLWFSLVESPRPLDSCNVVMSRCVVI